MLASSMHHQTKLSKLSAASGASNMRGTSGHALSSASDDEVGSSPARSAASGPSNQTPDCARIGSRGVVRNDLGIAALLTR